MKKIKVCELFAGVGGFRLGLEASSKLFETVFANQWEPGRKAQWAFECYIKKFGECENHSNEDIHIAREKVKDHDLLVGGFPCQDYSVAHGNIAKGIQGKKGVLWWDIHYIIKNKKPTFVLLENVDRLIRSPYKQRGRDFGIILLTLSTEGYNCEWRVINAADYGHSQRRRRVFLFASKKENRVELFKKTEMKEILLSEGFFAKSFPIESLHSKKEILEDDLNRYNKADINDFTKEYGFHFLNAGVMIDGKIITAEVLPQRVEPITLGSIIEQVDVDSKHYLNGSAERIEYMKAYKRIPRIKPNGEQYFYSEGQMAFPDALDRPARTMLTSEASVNRTSHVVKDVKSGNLRYLTAEECEKLNGFEPGWTDTGMPYRFRYFCMGNALVVPLVRTMGERIVELWGKLDGNE